MDIRNIMLPILLGLVATPANLNEISNLESADLPEDSYVQFSKSREIKSKMELKSSLLKLNELINMIKRRKTQKNKPKIGCDRKYIIMQRSQSGLEINENCILFCCNSNL